MFRYDFYISSITDHRQVILTYLLFDEIFHLHQSPDPYTAFAKGSSFVNKNDKEKIWVCWVCWVDNKQRSTDNWQ